MAAVRTGRPGRGRQEPVTTVGPYVIAIVLLTLLTCLYTAVGGIKAVIWTDVIQATLMFGSALVAIGTLLYHIGGDSSNATVRRRDACRR